MSNKVKISELKKGDKFKNEFGTFKCVQPYLSKHYPAKVVVINSTIGIEPGTSVGGFKHNSLVELIK